MRRPRRLRIAIAALLLGAAPAAGQAPGAGADAEEVEDALEEPADPDDALDIGADQDPDDVGQGAMEPRADEEPGAESPGSSR